MDVYTIVSYGTKISEVSRNAQEKVKYNLETMLGVSANSVNFLSKVYVYCQIRQVIRLRRMILRRIISEGNEYQRSQFQEMVQAGAARLQVNAEFVNSLNVFPVPDGDTGTIYEFINDKRC